MPARKYAAAAAAAAMLMAQPCLAAPDMQDTGATERRSSAFAGVRLRLPIGTGNPERPSARLQLTTVHDYRNAAGATVRSVRPDGLELGLNRRDNLIFGIAGQDAGEMQRRHNIGGSTTTLVVVGGVLVLVLVALVVANDPGEPLLGQ